MQRRCNLSSSRMKNARHYRSGWLPDFPDHRDKLYEEIMKRPSVLPSRVDLREHCSAVKFQRHLQSCTSHAIAAALELLEKRDRVHFDDMSRLFIYYNERKRVGTTAIDSGARIRDGIKSLAKHGVCPELHWPYVISKFRQKPPRMCYREAKKHRITAYYRLKTLTEMRTCLAEGFPILCGISLYERFVSKRVARTGIVELPRKDEAVIGGHAVLVVGYEDRRKRFLVRNSWGKNWGQEGYCTMPYEYLENRHYSTDFWTIHRAANL